MGTYGFESARYLRTVSLLLALGLGACSAAGDDDDDTNTGTGGALGTGGTVSGTGGTAPAGTGGKSPAGSGGTVAAAGSGGGAAPGSGGNGGTGGTAPVIDGGMTDGMVPTDSTFPPAADFGADGTFTPVRVEEGPSCTFYHPTVMGEEGRKHPVIVWGNGTGGSNTSYQSAHNHFASHGFIVAAANTANSGSATEMIACLDWLSAENDKPTGTYAGMVDMTKIASSGHSQGGCATLMAGRDPRVIVTAPVQPYILIPLGGCSYSSAIGEQHGPMFLMSGSADTIAVRGSNQAPIFEDAEVPVFWGTKNGADHLGAATGTMDGYRAEMTAWFRFHLMNDQEAKKMFYGADCTLCGDSSWEVEKKMVE